MDSLRLFSNPSNVLYPKIKSLTEQWWMNPPPLPPSSCVSGRMDSGNTRMEF